MTKKNKDRLWVGILFLYIGIGLLFIFTTIDFREEEHLYYKLRNDYIDCKGKFDTEKAMWIDKQFYQYLEEEYCITSFDEWCKKCDSILLTPEHSDIPGPADLDLP